MKRLKAVVEIMGSDPFGIRQQCQQYCDEHLLGEPFSDNEGVRQDVADGLLAGYLRTISPDTTGAASLIVSVVEA